MSNPYQGDDGWYFHDEVTVDRYGPFKTEEEAGDELFLYCTSALICSPVEPTGDDDLRAWWREQGGRFHGPNVETGTMPEEQLLPALRGLFEQLNDAQQRCERFAERLLDHRRRQPEQHRSRDVEG